MSEQRRIYPKNPILIVDDEESLLLTYREILEEENITNILCCPRSEEVCELIEKHHPELLLLDLLMPNLSGTEMLEHILNKYPSLNVIVITGDTSPSTIVKCLKLGVYDYIDKPLSSERLITSVRNALSFNALQRENRSLVSGVLSSDLKKPEAFSHIITSDSRIFSIFKYIEAIANSPYPVLITGETGTGKELIARAIYNVMDPKGKFIAVNTSGLDDNMFLDTLFGHKKGAFTGAMSNRKGLVEIASDGLLFLDEIGDISQNCQVKLLRLLQENEYQPLGSDRTLHANIRIVCATNRNLSVEVRKGHFREDLYYRLSIHHIHLPPLRERRGDIPLLIEHFIKKHIKKWKKNKIQYNLSDIVKAIRDYPFPGNIRELEFCVADCLARCQTEKLSPDVFSSCILERKDKLNNYGSEKKIIEYKEERSPVDENIFAHINNLPSLKDVQFLLIKEALKRTNGNKTLAAKLIKTSRQALSWHLKNKSKRSFL